MLPKIVLHKQNGHRQPAPVATTAAQILRLVHSAPPDAMPPAALARLGAVAYTERTPLMLDHAAREVDSLREALSVALAETEDAFARGEMPDVRAMLVAFRDQASGAADLLRDLVATAERRAEQLVDLNALLTPIPDVFQLSLAAGQRLHRHLSAVAPRVAADEKALREAFVALVGCGNGDVTIETGVVPGGVADEPRARVTVRHSGPFVPGFLAQTETVARVVRALGGILDRELTADGACFVVELPHATGRGAR